MVTSSDCETQLSIDMNYTLENEVKDITQFLQGQEIAWLDAVADDTNAADSTVATSETEPCALSLDPIHPIDCQMICDIKAIASRLASKSH